MIVYDTVAALRDQRQQWQQERVAFVPTMGNLHAGHLQLVKCAQQHADKVIVSIFVNPLQFAPHEDFASYPRTSEQDLKALESHGVDAVFMPAADVILPVKEGGTRVLPPPVAQALCGASRPGFFEGVCTILVKLFNMVEPNCALFGEKDFQQCLVVKQMVTDLNFPIEIIPVATVRESNGLALSSRNQYLTTTDKQNAAQLYQTLLKMQQQIVVNDLSYIEIEAQGKKTLTEYGFRVDYLTICHAQTLQAPQPHDKQLLIAAAVFLGKTRLIDNIQVAIP